MRPASAVQVVRVLRSEVREAIMAGEEGWRAMNAKFGGLVKPDIVFFGEQLPRRFYELAGIPVHPGMDCSDSDFASCDLLIVMGTSLVVQPFASLIDQVCACARDSLRARVTLGVSQTLRGPSRTPIVTAAVRHRQKAPNLTRPHSRRCRRTARACC